MAWWHTAAWGLAWALAAAWLGWAALAVAEWRSLRRLNDQAPDLPPEPPHVTVVFAARQEAGTPEAAAALEEAVRSMCGQRYPHLDVVAVDDRSSDGTGPLLRRLAQELPRLRVLRVDELPRGWLGKPHALARGAAEARGQWLLFTDADVRLAPDAVARAVAYAERQRLDHLAVAPHLVARGVGLQALLAFFSLLFAQLAPPSLVRAGRVAVGIGAFNLVRADLYRRAGGHGPIRMRPDDDIQLGRLLRAAGARQDLLPSGGLVSVPWYPSLAAAIRGFEKNAYAGSDYSLLRFAGQLALLVALHILPFAWAVAGAAAAAAGVSLPGWPAVAVAAGIALALGAAVARDAGLPAWTALLAPAGAVLFAYALVRAVWLAERAGGIHWRETFYSLAELRRARRPGAGVP